MPPMTLRRALALAVLAAGLAVAMRFSQRTPIAIDAAADEPSTKADEFPFSPRPNRAREIHWQKWSPEVFEEAKKSGKPVVVSLTATWCQKCHEMDENAFSDGKVIAFLNENFLCVRVDTDKRPDVKDRYLSAQGWPTTAVCVPSGEVITKTWLAPPAEFLKFLQDALDGWNKNHDAILKRVSEMKGPPAPAAVPPDALFVDAIAKAIDATWSDTGWAVGDLRFPSPQNATLAAWRGDAKRAQDGLELALRVEDPVDGGFYRVGMKPDWSEPHYEKLLEAQADMLAGLVAVGRGNEKLGKAAARTYGYLKATLALPGGGWAGSQDADPDYFRAADRGKLARPRVDTVFYPGPNAQAASAVFAFAASAGDAGARDAAVAALERAFRESWTADGLLHCAGGGRDFLRDLALLGDACLDAHQATGEWTWVKRAQDVAARIETLKDGNGALLDRPPDPAAPGALRFQIRKSADNGRAAGFLVRLFHVTDEEKWKTLAAGALKATGGEAKQYPAYSAEYAIGMLKLLKFPLHVVVVGPKAELAKMVEAVDRFPHPWKTVAMLESKGEAVKYAGLEYPPTLAAYCCVDQACGPPVTEPAEFEEKTKAFLERNR